MDSSIRNSLTQMALKSALDNNPELFGAALVNKVFGKVVDPIMREYEARVFEVISNNFGKTCAELGELTGLGHQETQWRVNDLKNDGLVEYDNRRKCSVKGTSRSLVWLTERGAMIMNVRHIKQAKRAVA
ncbi:MAG: helix-turn-helix domain-containing protein [Thiomicrorhabdus sp.]|jgi:hypothetical protein|nr:helix-turn-helix domain-containing protein [Thiomicrorhabdus sp.]